MKNIILFFALILCIVAAESRASPDDTPCQQALSLKKAQSLLEQGLCQSAVKFQGRPVCDDWHAFLAGTAPTLPVSSFAVGPTFRVERANNGHMAWSEHNPMYVLYNAGKTGLLTNVRLLAVNPDNAEEEQEGIRYLSAAFAGKRDASSSLQQYIESRANDGPLIPLTNAQDQAVADLGCGGRIYIRQHGKRLYVLLSTKHSNAWEYDTHPVLYFVIMAPP
jgi:hypothetical protein